MIHPFGSNCPKCDAIPVSVEYQPRLFPSTSDAAVYPSAWQQHLTCHCACGHVFWSRTKDFVEQPVPVGSTLESRQMSVLYIAPNHHRDDWNVCIGRRFDAVLLPLSRADELVPSRLWAAAKECSERVLFYNDVEHPVAGENSPFHHFDADKLRDALAIAFVTQRYVVGCMRDGVHSQTLTNLEHEIIPFIVGQMLDPEVRKKVLEARVF